MKITKYEPKTETQLKNWYDKKVRDKKNGFDSFQDFLDWYKKQENKEGEKCCYYCGLTEEESQRIVMEGKLESNRFPKDGKIEKGKNRGVWLEIDRDKPKGDYSKDNCVLACYFCNNDKSDVFKSAKEYIKFKKNRLEYLKKLLNLNSKNAKELENKKRLK